MMTNLLTARGSGADPKQPPQADKRPRPARRHGPAVLLMIVLCVLGLIAAAVPA